MRIMHKAIFKCGVFKRLSRGRTVRRCCRSCSPGLFTQCDCNRDVFITSRNEVVAKVMFLLVSVILLTGGGGGGGLPQCMLGYHPPGADTPPEQTSPQEQTSPGANTPWSRPPRSRHPPGADTPREQTPPRADTPQSRHPPPPSSRLRHTFILLECILVLTNGFFWILMQVFKWCD